MLSFGFKIIPAPPVLFHGMLNISLFISKFYEWTRLKRFKTSYYFSFFFFLLKLHSIFRLLFCTVFLLSILFFYILYSKLIFFFIFKTFNNYDIFYSMQYSLNSIQICKYKVKCLSNVELRYRESG